MLHEHRHVFEELIRQGANLNLKPLGQKTALLYAITTANKNSVRRLLNAGANPAGALTGTSNEDMKRIIRNHALPTAQGRALILARQAARNARLRSDPARWNHVILRRRNFKKQTVPHPVPVNIPWSNLGNKIDPFTLQGRVGSDTTVKWPKNGLAIEVKHPNRNMKSYHDPKAFNKWYGNSWKNMDPVSKNAISNKKHVQFQRVIPRNTVRLVRFTGPRFNTNTAARIIQTAVRRRNSKV